MINLEIGPTPRKDALRFNPPSTDPRKTQHRPIICTRPRWKFQLDGDCPNPGITTGRRSIITLVTSTLHATHSYYNIRKRLIALVTVRSYISLSARNVETNTGRKLKLPHLGSNPPISGPSSCRDISPDQVTKRGIDNILASYY